jgi:hypothetical protein
VHRGPVRRRRPKFIFVFILLILLGVGYMAYKYFAPKTVEEAVEQLQFDENLSENEKQTIINAMQKQSKTYKGSVRASVKTTLEADAELPTLMAYVPVTNVYASRQTISKTELKNAVIYVPADIEDKTRSALAAALELESSDISVLDGELTDIKDTEIAFVPASQLSSSLKLLNFDGNYYLDSYALGAVFRQVIFSGSDAGVLSDLKLNELTTKDTTLKINMTGVTALTRVMQRKLATVKDPLYFSEKIGDFLADADITHVSNEVSFRDGCQYSSVSFCSPKEFIETLKDSGVDLVELTGNHNNDNGSIFNTESINLYHGLGMATFGGGLNKEEAAKPHLEDKKGSKITFLGYNMADGAGSGAIAGNTTAGANIYTESKAKVDIEAARQTSQFVIVNIQYAECQAYPAGYVEFPLCDGTIGGQEEAFRQMIDFGADMVVGSSAHQPQTYELYEGKPIYYGLGNLYFDQTQWPGTERGIILTHYFAGGKLLQTKLSPTEYDKDFQTRLMDIETAVYLLERLNDAR